RVNHPRSQRPFDPARDVKVPVAPGSRGLSGVVGEIEPQGGTPGQLEDSTAFEVDHGEAGPRLDHEVAERIEEAVAAVVGDADGGGVEDPEEARVAAAMRDVGAMRGMPAGDEGGVGPLDQLATWSVETPALDRGRADAVESDHAAPLDVLGAVPVRLADSNFDPAAGDPGDAAVDPQASGRLELDREQADRGAGAQGGRVGPVEDHRAPVDGGGEAG